jgi:hypothetical protein
MSIRLRGTDGVSGSSDGIAASGGPSKPAVTSLSYER